MKLYRFMGFSVKRMIKIDIELKRKRESKREKRSHFHNFSNAMQNFDQILQFS